MLEFEAKQTCVHFVPLDAHDSKMTIPTSFSRCAALTSDLHAVLVFGGCQAAKEAELQRQQQEARAWGA